MGDIADMILDGILDEQTGEYIGEAVGYPRTMQKGYYNSIKKRQPKRNIKHAMKGYDMPTSVHQPELNVIIERLQSAVNRYDDIVCETRTKLQTIKKYEEPSTLNEAVKEKQPESATDEINRLLFRLNDLNETAEINLRHLREIV